MSTHSFPQPGAAVPDGTVGAATGLQAPGTPGGTYPPGPAANEPLRPAIAAAGLPPNWLLAAPRWLLWREEPHRDDSTKKPRKVPYYVGGGKREGVLGSPEDIGKLASFFEAVEQLNRLPGAYAGLGFALGGGYQGIDLDDVGSNNLGDLAEQLPGYVEYSPSRSGCHAIGLGRQFTALGSNGSGIEAYCTGRFFTFTGSPLRQVDPSAPPDDLADFVEQRLATRHGSRRATVAAQVPTSGAVEVERLTPQQTTELRSALFFLSADGYKLWIDVGQALRSLGDAGRGMWMEWSATCPEKFDPSEATRKWRGFEPHSLSYRSIFHWAQERGWVNPASSAAQVATPRVDAPAPKSWSLVSVADTFVNPEPPIEFLVEDLLPAREVTLLPADGGTGKSLLTLIAAVCQAMGLPFMGKAVTRSKVIFYSGEDDARVLRGRLRRVCEHYDVDPTELADWLQVIDATDNPTLFTEVYESEVGVRAIATHGLADLGRRVGDWGARVLVIDNASDTHDANENVRASVRAFIRGLKDIAKKYNAAVWLLAHLDKASVRGDGGRAKFSGSTAWHNSVRSRLLLLPHSEQVDYLVLSQEKSNHGRRSAAIELTWTAEGVLVQAGGGVRLPAPTPEELQRLILNLIRSHYERGQYISTSLAPNATTGAYAVLKADQSYPRYVDRTRLATLLRQAQAAGRLEAEQYKHPTRRHTEERWRVP